MFQQHHECEREKDSLLPPSLSVGHLPTLPARALRPGLGPGWPFKSLLRRMFPTEKDHSRLLQMPWGGPGILLRF